MKHKCKFCNETNPEKFYGRSKQRCKNCHNIKQQLTWKKNRYLVIDEMGAKCCICGYDSSYVALQMHYIIPNTKHKRYNVWGKSYKFWKEESKKCVLLCSNCHSEYHNGIFSLYFEGKNNELINNTAQNTSQLFSVLEAMDTDIDSALKQIILNVPKENKQCELESCTNMFVPDKSTSKYCSYKCAGLGTRKVTRPPIEQLLKEIEETNYSIVGRKYGVSDNAIRKWIKSGI